MNPQTQQALAQALAHQAQQAQQAQQALAQNPQTLMGGVGTSGVFPQAPATQTPVTQAPATQHARARALFFARMNGIRGGFNIGADDFIHCQVYKEAVYLFFLLGDKTGIVNEPVDIFPSDQLIAQFRMVTTP